MSRSQLIHIPLIIVVALAAGMFYGLLSSEGRKTDPPAVAVHEEAASPPAASVEMPPSRAPIQTLTIEAIGVAAPVIVLSADSDGVMDTPSGPMQVAWYDFSGYPGHAGNAVFAGHVDHVSTGAAVFYELRELKAGDSIEVALADGSSYRYAVTSLRTYDDATAPVGEIVGRTERESITLITCIGTFDPVTKNYDKRLIVRAERVYL